MSLHGRRWAQCPCLAVHQAQSHRGPGSQLGAGDSPRSSRRAAGRGRPSPPRQSSSGCGGGGHPVGSTNGGGLACGCVDVFARQKVGTVSMPGCAPSTTEAQAASWEQATHPVVAAVQQGAADRRLLTNAHQAAAVVSLQQQAGAVVHRRVSMWWSWQRGCFAAAWALLKGGHARMHRRPEEGASEWLCCADAGQDL